MKKWIISLAFMLSVGFAQAQLAGSNIFSMAWDIGFPTNNNFLTEPGLGGFRFDYKKFINDNWSVGLAISWNSYSQYIPTQTYSQERTAVTTDMDRHIYNVPMAITAHYHFTKDKDKKWLPYAGLALGAQYSDQSIYYNIYLSEEKTWGFLVRPEIGTYYWFSDSFGAYLGGSYAWSTNKNEAFKMDDLTNFGLQLGIAWKM